MGASCKAVCTRVSFNRPYDPTTPNLASFELPLVHFLEETGYDVSYTTDVDTDRAPGELLRHRLVIVAGHLYLALIHRSTRHSLRGITLGTVSEEWAHAHHAKWVTRAPPVADESSAAQDPHA